METITSIHHEHTETQSAIQFYTKEINFILRLISSEIKKQATNANLNLLNAYSEVLEEFKGNLISLHKEIILHEKNFVSIYTANRSALQRNTLSEEEIKSTFKELVDELQITKESLYALLTQLRKK